MLNHTQNSNNKGYIALISAIIISAILMAITFSTGSSGFFGRLNILNNEFKERSSALAEACVDTALLKLAENISYAGNESISVGTDQCQIFTVETLSGQKIIKTKAIFQNAVTNLKITVLASDLSVVSWEEMPKF